MPAELVASITQLGDIPFYAKRSEQLCSGIAG